MLEDTLSNLTSATSNEAASISSTSMMNPNPNPNHLQTTLLTQPPPSKKRRNLPGNPDPEAEVVALSPRSLMATNRFVCEICNKGFQRDQNLQLHRRGHNLPWKLKQRSKDVIVKKKVYVCPEASCVHHDPSRALGDLTGIKKHYFRKHGEKKWKCEKCSKRYAVQSDWKAHSKICGTREYRCDCGTLFSRRDSFITHRAFCDALAEESSRSMTQNPNLSFQASPNFTHLIPNHLKQEAHNSNFTLPPWLSSSHHHHQSGQLCPLPLSPSMFSSPRVEQLIHGNPNPNPNSVITLPSSSSCLMSATALLQKAAQMGVTMSNKTDQSNLNSRPHHHVSVPGLCATTSSTAVFPSRDDMGTALLHGLASFGNKLANVTQGCMELEQGGGGMNSSSLLPSTSRFDTSSLAFNDHGVLNEMINPKQIGLDLVENVHLMGSRGKGSGTGSNDLTRDFLGLRAFPHRDFINMDGFDQMGSSSYDQNQSLWQC